MTLYERLKKVVEKPEDLASRYSDIHVKHSPEAVRVIKEYYKEVYPNQGKDFGWKMVTHFTNQITHEHWMEIPFGYGEYFEKKAGRK